MSLEGCSVIYNYGLSHWTYQNIVTGKGTLCPVHSENLAQAIGRMMKVYATWRNVSAGNGCKKVITYGIQQHLPGNTEGTVVDTPASPIVVFLPSPGNVPSNHYDVASHTEEYQDVKDETQDG